MTYELFSGLYGAIRRRFGPLLRTFCCEFTPICRVSDYLLYSSMRYAGVIPCNEGETLGMDWPAGIWAELTLSSWPVAVSCQLPPGARAPADTMWFIEELLTDSRQHIRNHVYEFTVALGTVLICPKSA